MREPQRIDTALFLDVTAGHALDDADVAPPPMQPFAEAARSGPGRLRIAVSTKPVIPVPIDDEVRSGVEQTADVLRSLGHDVRERDPAYGNIGNIFLPRYLRGIPTTSQACRSASASSAERVASPGSAVRSARR